MQKPEAKLGKSGLEVSALGAVALTITIVALVAKVPVTVMLWAAAIALGAIVAPPDAAAATAGCTRMCEKSAETIENHGKMCEAREGIVRQDDCGIPRGISS